MSEQLYNTEILRLAASIPHQERLTAPQGTSAKVSPVCGSRVTADVELDADGRVARYGQDVRACALGQAAAAILGAGVLGRSPAELARARDALTAFLRDGAEPPPEWPRLSLFAPARPHKARHGSILLAFQAAAEAAELAAAGSGPAAQDPPDAARQG
jgi:NifU-like protein involved in Fe-S cluster formation